MREPGHKVNKNGRRSITLTLAKLYNARQFHYCITTHASFSCCQSRLILYSCQGLDSFMKRPFPNCLVPLFQSEASCKTPEMAYWKKVSLLVTKSEDKFSPSKNISSFFEGYAQFGNRLNGAGCFRRSKMFTKNTKTKAFRNVME